MLVQSAAGMFRMSSNGDSWWGTFSRHTVPEKNKKNPITSNFETQENTPAKNCHRRTETNTPLRREGAAGSAVRGD